MIEWAIFTRKTTFLIKHKSYKSKWYSRCNKEKVCKYRASGVALGSCLVAAWAADVLELLWSAHVASLFSALFSMLPAEGRNITVSVIHFLYSTPWASADWLRARATPRPVQIWAVNVKAKWGDYHRVTLCYYYCSILYLFVTSCDVMLWNTFTQVKLPCNILFLFCFFLHLSLLFYALCMLIC